MFVVKGAAALGTKDSVVVVSTVDHHRGPILNIATDWWDGARNDSFFRTVYFVGDDSLEGHLAEREMDRDERTKRDVHGVLQLLRPLCGREVLDCPCGQGRLAIRLAQRHEVSVIGVDLNAPAVEEAGRCAAKLGIGNVEWRVGDMRQVPVEDCSVDYVLNFFLSFGFFGPDADNRMVAREFRRVLRPDGRLLLHTDVNPHRIETGTYGDRGVRTLRNGGELRIIEQYDRESKRLVGSWTTIDQDRQIRESGYSIRIYSNDEMVDLLRDAGFRDVRVCPFRARAGENIKTCQEVAYVAIK